MHYNKHRNLLCYYHFSVDSDFKQLWIYKSQKNEYEWMIFLVITKFKCLNTRLSMRLAFLGAISICTGFKVTQYSQVPEQQASFLLIYHCDDYVVSFLLIYYCDDIIDVVQLMIVNKVLECNSFSNRC